MADGLGEGAGDVPVTGALGTAALGEGDAAGDAAMEGEGSGDGEGEAADSLCDDCPIDGRNPRPEGAPSAPTDCETAIPNKAKTLRQKIAFDCRDEWRWRGQGVEFTRPYV